MKRSIVAAMACLAAFLPLALSGARAQSVVTYHNSPDRSGAYVVPGLNVSAAAKLHLDSHFNANVTGNVYAQPLYWLPPDSKTGILIVATSSNLVYGPNANTGAVIWKTQLAGSAPLSSLGCGNIDPGAGAPILTTTDGGANAIFWVTGAGGDNLLHGFDALTGKAVFSGAGTAMAGLRRYSTPIAANRHLYAAADGTVYAFKF